MADEPVTTNLERDAAASGMSREFVTTCLAHQPRVVGLCRRLLPSGSQIDAEDAAQEVMLRAFRAWSRFETGTNPWPWLSAIAANVCRDVSRRELRATAFASAPAPTEELAPDAHEDFERRAANDLLRVAIASLPATYRTPLYLRDIEGWSVAEIAELRGCTSSAVRSSLTRARKLLVARIEQLVQTRGEWSLPVALPVVGRLRSAIARLRARVLRMANAGVFPEATGLLPHAITATLVGGAMAVAGLIDGGGAAQATQRDSVRAGLAAERTALGVSVGPTARAAASVDAPTAGGARASAESQIIAPLGNGDVVVTATYERTPERTRLERNETVRLDVVGLPPIEGRGETTIYCDSAAVATVMCDAIDAVWPVIPASQS